MLARARRFDRIFTDYVVGLLCEEEGGDLGEFSDGGRVRVGDHVAEVVERVVQVVHPPTLAGVDAVGDAMSRTGSS